MGPLAVGTQQGGMTLTSDRFFDDGVFDPSDMAGYLAKLP